MSVFVLCVCLCLRDRIHVYCLLLSQSAISHAISRRLRINKSYTDELIDSNEEFEQYVSNVISHPFYPVNPD